MPEICSTSAVELRKEFIEEEKRACSLVRKVLGMSIEKRTLIDHLTDFRKEFGLPNKLRGMIVRHPESVCVSLKGQRNSVLLMEEYDEKGRLLEKYKFLETREKLMELVRKGKRMRREKRRSLMNNAKNDDFSVSGDNEFDTNDDDDDDHDSFEIWTMIMMRSMSFCHTGTMQY